MDEMGIDVLVDFVWTVRYNNVSLIGYFTNTF